MDHYKINVQLTFLPLPSPPPPSLPPPPPSPPPLPLLLLLLLLPFLLLFLFFFLLLLLLLLLLPLLALRSSVDLSLFQNYLSNFKCFSTKLFFGMGFSATRPTPNLDDQGIPFGFGHQFWPVWHGRPYQ